MRLMHNSKLTDKFEWRCCFYGCQNYQKTTFCDPILVFTLSNDIKTIHKAN